MSTPSDPTPHGVPSSVAGPAADVPVEEVSATSPLGTDLPPADAPVAGDAPTAAPTAAPTTRSERQPDLRPLYAVAGLTDVLVGAVRTTVTETQHWASARIAELRFRQAELEKQAAELRERADVLPDQVKTLPDVTRSRVNELQQQASSTYADLASRGQRLVQGVAGRVDPVFDRVQERVDAARRVVTGRGGAAPVPTGPAPATAVVPDAVAPDLTTASSVGDVPESDPLATPAGVPAEELTAEEVLLTEGAENVTPDEELVEGATDGTDEGSASPR
jgi:heparin binding hemagglutinin HbhA